MELLKPQAAKHMVKFAEGAVKPSGGPVVGAVGGAMGGMKKTASESLVSCPCQTPLM